MNKNTNGGYTAPQDKRQFLVGIYHREWTYGGAAEGGWYYDTGNLCSVSYRRFYHEAAAINYARVGAQKIWAGTVRIKPDAKTGAHHHGELESVIYVIKGKARMRWGENLEYVAEAKAGDFIFVPPYVPHQEINASPDETLECVLVRSDNESVVVNLDIEAVEKPESVLWIDPIHKAAPPL